MATLDKSFNSSVELQACAFAELHCLSNYSFLRGASHPEELVKQAKMLGYKALALTDECTYAGLVKAHIAAKDLGIKLIIGSEFEINLPPSDDNAEALGAKVVLLAPDRATYGQLSALISKLRRRANKGEYAATLDDFRWGMKGCLALWILPVDQIGRQMFIGETLKTVFPELWIALELFRDGHDLDKTAHALTLSMRLNLPIVAANDVHTHQPERQPLQDLLTAVRLKTQVSEVGLQGFANAERTLRSVADLQQLYAPEMLAETMVIANRCQFSMDELRYEYPEDLVPPHLTPHAYLRQLTMAGARERWPAGIPPDMHQLLDKELGLIAELNYEHYFLTVQDIVQFARSQNILCQGRGSAANSAVCYCLHVTEVDPDRMHLLFERFVSKERNEPPDIDVDFEHERREEVIQYIYKRYGRDRAALAATLVCYRPRSAIRDVGKALGLSADVTDLLAKSMAWWDKKEEIPARLRAAGLDPESLVAEQFLYFVNEILGFPRHLSQHVGGFVISRGPLAQLVPVENASMPERTVIQWDKDDLEALGLLKIDVLALGMLTAIRKSLQVLNAYNGTSLTVEQIPAEDPQTYAMLQAGDSVGVFQVESRAQMAMLPRLKPQHFYDLVIEVAIVRPGPIQGDMVHPYLRRRQGLEPIHYPSEAVRQVLERTLGIPIFQEQVIELAMVAAGFSAGEADQLRRAMAAWKKRGGLEVFEQKLVDGMLARGHDKTFAQRVFKQIKGFGDYGFPESHAASFALLVYVSSWLKCHEPAAFYCGLLNSLPMGFYSPAQLIQDAQRHNIEVREIDVCISQWAHTLEPLDASLRAPAALRLGLRMVKGLNEETAQRISQARQQQPFADAADLARRAGLNDQTMRFLARAGALKQISGHRHQAHWQVAGIHPPLPLETANVVCDAPDTEQEEMPVPSVKEDLLDDYRYTGLTLGPHPMQVLRSQASLKAYRTAEELLGYRQGQMIRIAGLVTGRQRPGTATGVVFLTLEDETGNINVVIWSSVLQRYRAALLQGQLLKIKGVVEREGTVIHVVAGHVEDATEMLTDMSLHEASSQEQSFPFKSRDFH
ncbi:MAG: error-prone DNA polymerase [Pseudomonadaceae bacterium]|nr:error-prone DNA polymerase [Pseudomonadaceae bacterium]